MKNLFFGVHRPSGSPPKPKALKQLASRLLGESDGRCFFCRFQSMKYNVLTPRFSDPYDLDNLVIACPLCSSAINGGLWQDKIMGRLIYIPQIDQVALNLLVHGCLAGVSAGGEHQVNANTLIRELSRMEAPLEEHYGSGASNCKVMASALRMMKKTSYEQRSTLLYGLRYLPDPGLIPSEIKEYYRDHVYSKTSSRDWPSILAAVQASFDSVGA